MVKVELLPFSRVWNWNTWRTSVLLEGGHTYGRQGSCGCAPMQPPSNLKSVDLSLVVLTRRSRIQALSIADSVFHMQSQRPKHATHLFCTPRYWIYRTPHWWVSWYWQSLFTVHSLLWWWKTQSLTPLLFLIFFHKYKNYNIAPQWLPQDTIYPAPWPSKCNHPCHKPHPFYLLWSFFHKTFMKKPQDLSSWLRSKTKGGICRVLLLLFVVMIWSNHVGHMHWAIIQCWTLSHEPQHYYFILYSHISFSLTNSNQAVILIFR